MLQFFSEPHAYTHTEGELYKVINLHGQKIFICYGYYDDRERQNPAIEPIPIYPDFLEQPRFTPEGHRFVTKMQDACEHYEGPSCVDRECADCRYYSHGEDLLGICTHSAQKMEVV